jgi:hypothetical protein
VCKLQIELMATLGLKFAGSLRNSLELIGICRAALEEIGKVASALGPAYGRKMELPWMADQMLENAWPQRRTSLY